MTIVVDYHTIYVNPPTLWKVPKYDNYEFYFNDETTEFSFSFCCKFQSTNLKLLLENEVFELCDNFEDENIWKRIERQHDKLIFRISRDYNKKLTETIFPFSVWKHVIEETSKKLTFN